MTLTMSAPAPGSGRGRLTSVRALAAEPWLLLLVGATAVADAAAAILRHVQLESGLDVAIFDQAIWHLSRFEAPLSSIKGENLFGDHFHPIIVVLAPLYWIWSDPRMLLVAQALLVAGSIIPVFVFAQRRLPRSAAYLLATAYALFWGLQVGVLFEFHEVAFAPLLIALAILLADVRRWTPFYAVIALLLCTKEDLSIFVVFFGIYLLTLRQIRHGIVLVVLGASWYELVTGVVIPHFANGNSYAYWTFGELGRNPLDALWGIVRAPWRLVTVGLSPAIKARTIVALFAPFLFLSLGSRLIILALPLLAERFLSSNRLFWGTHYHYSLAISPVLAMGAAAGLANLNQWIPERRRHLVLMTTAVGMLLASLVVTRLGTTDSAVSRLTQRSFYRPPVYSRGERAALARVPENASLATVDNLLPYASERSHLDLIYSRQIGTDQYLVVNLLQIGCCGHGGAANYQQMGSVVSAVLPALTPVYYGAGWLVARRPPPGQHPTDGVLTPMNRRLAATVNRTISRWQRWLGSVISGLRPCYVSLRHGGTAARGCFGSVLAGASGEHRALSQALRAAQRQGTGGCAQIAAGAASASDVIAEQIRAVQVAAASGSRSAPVTAFGALLTGELTQDDVGQISRFAMLCTPR